ncbi:uncharacterized protein TNCV_2880111 [Trichonephila clavipes]|uniref:Uncharacterized protein n=1 Tax=Trichonephila clavipes TaxID=2585209 RepID=A0A8X6W217_TRICX|nr:uncharacterized protein TNCV_2880111 [Trichonephila clavipes]
MFVIVVPLRHRSILNSRRDASLLVRFEEREKRWEAPDHPQGVLPQNWGGIKKNRTVTCMVLKAEDNDRPKNLAFSHDTFRGLMVLSIRWYKLQHQPIKDRVGELHNLILYLFPSLISSVLCGSGSLAVTITISWLACRGIEKKPSGSGQCKENRCRGASNVTNRFTQVGTFLLPPGKIPKILTRGMIVRRDIMKNDVSAHVSLFFTTSFSLWLADVWASYPGKGVSWFLERDQSNIKFMGNKTPGNGKSSLYDGDFPQTDLTASESHKVKVRASFTE